MKRKKEHISAIKIFLSVIENFSNEQVLELLKEMNQMEPIPTNTSSKLWSMDSIKRLKTMKYFDVIIQKACDVAGQQKKDKTYMIGEEGWLEILEFLQKLSNSAKSRI